ncbi:MAG: glycosyltransferase, partial [Erysipelotrichaceae bacterium]|nr:glycosyltransferase [Erysipelotrichaceae bacterium]
MNDNTDKIRYIDVTPTKNGCRILAAGSFEEDEAPALMVNHIPVSCRQAAASDGTRLIWTDFFFPAVHLKISLNDEVIAQVEQDELDWMQENASVYLDVKEAKWEGTRLILSGRVISPFLETVRLSVQDEWGRPVETVIQRRRDEGMKKAGLEFEDCFEMEVNPGESRQLWLVMEDSRHLIREQLAMPPVSEQQKSITEKAMEFVSMGFGPAFYKIKNHFMNQNRADGYHAWFEKQKPDKFRLENQRKTKFANPPKISLAVPAWNTPLEYFDEMVQSVLDQTYPNWQLCIADGSDNDTLQKHVLESYGDEPRIVYRKLERNCGISGNMNEAVKMCDGDWIGFFDHDDLITPDALFEAAKVMEADRPDLIYTDEDKL